MDIKECLEILEYHSKWRKGYKNKMLSNVVVDEAIDRAINELSLKVWVNDKDKGIIKEDKI